MLLEKEVHEKPSGNFVINGNTLALDDDARLHHFIVNRPHFAIRIFGVLKAENILPACHMLALVNEAITGGSRCLRWKRVAIFVRVTRFSRRSGEFREWQVSQLLIQHGLAVC